MCYFLIFYQYIPFNIIKKWDNLSKFWCWYGIRIVKVNDHAITSCSNDNLVDKNVVTIVSKNVLVDLT